MPSYMHIFSMNEELFMKKHSRSVCFDNRQLPWTLIYDRKKDISFTMFNFRKLRGKKVIKKTGGILLNHKGVSPAVSTD